MLSKVVFITFWEKSWKALGGEACFASLPLWIHTDGFVSCLCEEATQRTSCFYRFYLIYLASECTPFLGSIIREDSKAY